MTRQEAKMPEIKREKLAFIRAAPKPSNKHLAEIVVVDEEGNQTVVPISLQRTLLIATTGLSLMHNKGVWHDDETDNEEDGSPQHFH